ncbi:peroxiredoxin [Candidatus Dependentiae bacterium]|nr:peroxiredoxin [Candidatus Dependentiae bacterium]
MTSLRIKIVAIVLSTMVNSLLIAQDSIKSCGPFIGDNAPHFKADSTRGTIAFPEQYTGKWVIFFSHPADFTPICTTEFKKLASMIGDLDKLNCKLVGISVDSAYTHDRWIKNLEKDIENKQKITFPVVADTSRRIAKSYGMIHPKASATQTVRSVFFIDPKGTIRAIFYYPITNGRNFDEIKRLLVALQTTDEKQVITPANWQPGQQAIKPKKEVKDALPD